MKASVSPNTTGPARRFEVPQDEAGSVEDNILDFQCHGISWYIMVYHGISWYIMVYHGISGIYIMVYHHGISWYIMVLVRMYGLYYILF